MGYSINSCRKIVFRDGNTNREIKEVWYCDNSGNAHKVWPVRMVLTNVYAVALGSSMADDRVSDAYTNDSNGQPNVTLLPGRVYTIKGDIDIYNDSGVKTDTIHNCYFFAETISNTGLSGTLHLYSANTSSYGTRTATRNSGYVTGQSNTYLGWQCDTEPGEDSGLSVQAGFYLIPEGYAQVGFLFDPNYSTPFIFKRATVTQNLYLSKSPASNSNIGSTIYSGYVTLADNSSLTFYPLWHKAATATGWHTYALTNWSQDISACNSYSYNSTTKKYTLTDVNNNVCIMEDEDDVFTITPANNGGFTITPRVIDDTTHYINIWDSNNNLLVEWGIVPVYSTIYTVYDGNSLVNDMTITSAKTLTIKSSTYDSSNSQWSTEQIYNGSCTITSSNSSIVSVSGKTLTPNISYSGQSAIITVSVDGRTIRTFTVTVGQNATVYCKVSNVTSSGTPSYSGDTYGQLNSSTDITFTKNAYDVSVGSYGYFTINFGLNSNVTTPTNVYIRPTELDEAPYLTTSEGTNVYFDTNGTNEFTFRFQKLGSSSAYEFNVEIPVYLDSSFTNYLGTIIVDVLH